MSKKTKLEQWAHEQLNETLEIECEASLPESLKWLIRGGDIADLLEKKDWGMYSERLSNIIRDEYINVGNLQKLLELYGEDWEALNADFKEHGYGLYKGGEYIRI